MTTDSELGVLDAFINIWTCARGGTHRVYKMCDCPGAHLDERALREHNTVMICERSGCSCWTDRKTK